MLKGKSLSDMCITMKKVVFKSLNKALPMTQPIDYRPPQFLSASHALEKHWPKKTEHGVTKHKFASYLAGSIRLFLADKCTPSGSVEQQYAAAGKECNPDETIDQPAICETTR